MNSELPCQLCGVLTLEDFLEEVGGRLVCPGCVEKLDEEEREEERADEFDCKQTEYWR